MMNGDRVRHQAGWFATVIQLQHWPFLVHVEADDPKLTGQYAGEVFEVVEPTTDDTDRVDFGPSPTI